MVMVVMVGVGVVVVVMKHGAGVYMRGMDMIRNKVKVQILGNLQ